MGRTEQAAKRESELTELLNEAREKTWNYDIALRIEQTIGEGTLSPTRQDPKGDLDKNEVEATRKYADGRDPRRSPT